MLCKCFLCAVFDNVKLVFLWFVRCRVDYLRCTRFCKKSMGNFEKKFFWLKPVSACIWTAGSWRSINFIWIISFLMSEFKSLWVTFIKDYIGLLLGKKKKKRKNPIPQFILASYIFWHMWSWQIFSASKSVRYIGILIH